MPYYRKLFTFWDEFPQEVKPPLTGRWLHFHNMMNMYVKQLKCHGFSDKTKNNDGLSHLADDMCVSVPFVADAKIWSNKEGCHRMGGVISHPYGQDAGKKYVQKVTTTHTHWVPTSSLSLYISSVPEKGGRCGDVYQHLPVNLITSLNLLKHVWKTFLHFLNSRTPESGPVRAFHFLFGRYAFSCLKSWPPSLACV